MQKFTQIYFLFRQILLYLLQQPGYVLGVFEDAAQFLLVKVRSELFAQQNLRDDVSYIRRARLVICKPLQ